MVVVTAPVVHDDNNIRIGDYINELLKAVKEKDDSSTQMWRKNSYVYSFHLSHLLLFNSNMIWYAVIRDE